MLMDGVFKSDDLQVLFYLLVFDLLSGIGMHK